MLAEILFLHFSNVLFILAVLILYLRIKNLFLLIMLLSMGLSQVVYWLPTLVDLPVWISSSNDNVMDESNLVYDGLQYTQLASEIITAVAFFIFALTFKRNTKATKKAKNSSK